MQVQVTGLTQVEEVPELNAEIFYYVVFDVDDSFAEDGTYHVRVENLVRSLRTEGLSTTASQWEFVCQQKGLTHVRLRAGDCQLWPRQHTEQFLSSLADMVRSC